MKIDHAITVDAPAHLVWERAAKWVGATGYKRREQHGDVAVFGRGSILGGLLFRSSRRAKSTVRIGVKPGVNGRSRVRIKLHVNAGGDMSREDELYWRGEFVSLCRTLESGELTLDVINPATSVRFAVATLGIAVALGLMSGLV